MASRPLHTEKFPGGSGQPGDGGPVTNVDNPQDHPEDNILLPWCVDPASSWLDYACYLEILLDPGSVLHKPLPQNNPVWDTLASIDIASEAFMSDANGINLNSNSTAVDVIQRMASSTYSFMLRGAGLRAGYRIPIPKLVKIGLVLAVPTLPNFVRQVTAGNLLGGIPLWYAEWELHYLVATSPKITQANQVPVPPNPAARIRPDAELPKAIIAPRMPADQRAVQTSPGVGALGMFVRRPQ